MALLIFFKLPLKTRGVVSIYVNVGLPIVIDVLLWWVMIIEGAIRVWVSGVWEISVSFSPFAVNLKLLYTYFLSLKNWKRFV